MTVTEENVSSSTAYVVELEAAAPLGRAIKNGLVCAATKVELVKSIIGIQLHFDGQQTLEVQATDRFVAFVEQVATSQEDGASVAQSFMLFLPRDECTRAVAFLKDVPKGHPVTVAWTPSTDSLWSAGSLVLRSYESSVALAVKDFEPPKIKGLFTKVSASTATAEVGLSKSILQAIGKIEAESRNPYLRVSLFGASRPQRIDWPDERRSMLVMPVRLLAGGAEWGVPGL